jgi:hypothetical protein
MRWKKDRNEWLELADVVERAEVSGRLRRSARADCKLGGSVRRSIMEGDFRGMLGAIALRVDVGVEIWAP